MIHGTHILTVCYGLFQRHIRAVEPLIVVNMLSHESYWGLCAVRLHEGQVEVVNEVHQLGISGRPVSLAATLVYALLQLVL